MSNADLLKLLADARALISDLYESYDMAHGHDYRQAQDGELDEHDQEIKDTNDEVDRVLALLDQEIDGA